ncbi:RNA-directed DNA polymerase from mobile element jockey, partial [Ophiophagus hannah]
MAIAVQIKDFEEVEYILTKNLRSLSKYEKWRLCPSPPKIAPSRIKHYCHLKYLGITLDQFLTFGKHFKVIRQKLKTRNNLIRKTVGTNWKHKQKHCIWWHNH